MSKKYELLKKDTIITDDGVKLHRIRALRGVNCGTHKGDVGGYIENACNLSHDGEAWVDHDARVYGGARVLEDARVSHNAQVSGYAQLSGHAHVGGDAQVTDHASIMDYGHVFNCSLIRGHAIVRGVALISGDAFLTDTAIVGGDAHLTGDAYITRPAQVVWFSHVGKEDGTLTVFPSKSGELLATCGFFYGTVKEFLAKSAEVNGERIQREYQLLIEVARSRIEAARGEAA